MSAVNRVWNFDNMRNNRQSRKLSLRSNRCSEITCRVISMWRTRMHSKFYFRRRKILKRWIWLRSTGMCKTKLTSTSKTCKNSRMFSRSNSRGLDLRWLSPGRRITNKQPQTGAQAREQWDSKISIRHMVRWDLTPLVTLRKADHQRKQHPWDILNKDIDQTHSQIRAVKRHHQSSGTSRNRSCIHTIRHQSSIVTEERFRRRFSSGIRIIYWHKENRSLMVETVHEIDEKRNT